ncbi:MAG TPA: histidinol dehydrogenase [Acidimicrobiales bacterium]|nr:histidinol dehydrogenase [Acidimicrobiales bacterium]
MPDLLTRLDLRGTTGDLAALLPAPGPAPDGPVDAVRAILAQVRAGGDGALRELTEQFDGIALGDVAVPASDIRAALDSIPAALRTAYEAAADAIGSYHRTQLHADATHTHAGVVVRDRRQPVDRAGCYVPGGLAPLASTVLMTAIPARVAGVAEVVLCSPPGPGGNPAAPILAAAAIAGVDDVYRIGGAQAIAAMAYGTESVAPVDVVVGPGNVYVAVAERIVAQEGVVGVPSSFPGPSEVAVVADDTTPVDFAAIDLVVQAEHGPGGWAWLVTWSEEAARRIGVMVDALAACSPRRESVTATLRSGGYVVLVDGPEQAMEVVNHIATEHLELMCADPESLVPLVRSAGAVFCGPWAPASVGDYVAGPNHVLPTARTARFASALRVDDFCKHLHVVSLDRDALAGLAPHVAAMAEAEGLPAHAASVGIRAAARGA